MTVPDGHAIQVAIDLLINKTPFISGKNDGILLVLHSGRQLVVMHERMFLLNARSLETGLLTQKAYLEV
jgi:hypothetical protein